MLVDENNVIALKFNETMECSLVDCNSIMQVERCGRDIWEWSWTIYIGVDLLTSDQSFLNFSVVRSFNNSPSSKGRCLAQHPVFSLQCGQFSNEIDLCIFGPTLEYPIPHPCTNLRRYIVRTMRCISIRDSLTFIYRFAANFLYNDSCRIGRKQ